MPDGPSNRAAKYQRILEPYRQAVSRHGPGFEATLWGSREAQVRRFDVFIDLLDLAQRVIVDAGCGQGDFAARLIERGVAFQRYVGIDAIDEMIRHAAARNLQRCQFITADLLADPGALRQFAPDYVCISGTLNTMDEPTARRFVAAAFEAASRGVAFNFLSDRPHPDWAGRDLGPARRFHTSDWLDWAFEQTSLVAFTQTYLQGHDATIILLHDQAPDTTAARP